MFRPTRLTLALALIYAAATPSGEPWQQQPIKVDTTNSLVVPETRLVPVPDDDLYVVGEGVDLLTGNRKAALCVTGGAPIKVPLGNQSASLAEAVDENSLSSQLNISVSAKGKYAGYSGGGSMSKSVD